MPRPEVEEALRRSGVVWVSLDGRPPRAVWHLWHEGAVHLVSGGEEQQLPGAASATRAVVSVRGRGSLGARRGELSAVVERLVPGTPQWDAVVPLLAAQRLNARDAAALPEQWARESVVLRVVPVG